MKTFYIVFFLTILHPIAAQYTLSGQWVGILVEPNNNFKSGISVLLEIDAVQKSIVGVFRLEKDANWLQYEVSGKYLKKESFTLQSQKEITLKKGQLSSLPFQIQFNYYDSLDLAVGLFSCSGSPYDGHTLYLEKTKHTYSLENKVIFNEAFVSKCLHDRSLGLASQVKRDNEIASFNFQPIFFAYDSYVIDNQYKRYLQQLVRVVNSHSDLRIEIVGNTDGDGSDEYNLNLSKNRAKAVQQFLEQNGISKTRISILFEGEKNPVDRNDTKEGKQRNRRVEIRFN